MELTQKGIITSKKDLAGRIILSFIILSLLGFLFSQYPSQTGDTWYHRLNQPFFAPPYWLPFVMWAGVYILMGCSAGIIWHIAAKSEHSHTRHRAIKGLGIFAVHLFFNLSYPIILIGWQKPVIGLIDMLILLGFIGYLIRFFYPINKTAAKLIIPYFFWIVYACALNIALIALN